MNLHIKEPSKSPTLGHGRLVDKVAIITGAGNGIGKEIALFFARERAAVVAANISFGCAENGI